MSEHDLQHLLEQLRGELDALEQGDGAANERLHALCSRLEHRLANPHEDNEDEELMNTVRDALTRYEVEHPRLTEILNRVMLTLGSMGI